MQQPGIMGRCLVFVAAIVALAGCYNPPYPSQGPGEAEPLPHEASTPQQQSPYPYRARRESSAGSGTTVPTE